MGGQKAAIVTQVGHFYFGAVGQFYIGGDSELNQVGQQPQKEPRQGGHEIMCRRLSC